jgi:toxin ParE1/3/4
MQVVIERAAKLDLQAIISYLENQASIDVAERFTLQAELALTQLASAPLMGSPWRTSNPRLQELRIWPVPGFRRYFVFYTSSDDRVEVLRVIHGARDISGFLEGHHGE